MVETHPFGSRRVLFAALMAFIVCGIVIYAEPLTSSLLSDDFVILKAVRDNGAFGIWTNLDADFFRPLSSLAFYWGYRAWSLEAFPYHLGVVLAHCLSSFLVCLIAYLLLIETGFSRVRRRLVSVAAGLIFLVLPSHSEPVSWIAAGIDVYAALFALGSLFAYILYRSVPRGGLLAASLGLLAISLLSKESAVGVPLVLVAYEIYLRISRRRRPGGPYADLRLPIPYFVVVALYFLLRRACLGTFIGGYGADVHLNFTPLRIAIGLACLPTRTYLPPMPTRAISLGVFLSIVLVVLAAVGTTHFRRRRQLPGIALLVLVSYFIFLLPVINLSAHLVDTQGERFVYSASAFGAILVVTLLGYLLESRRFLMLILACILVAYAASLLRSNHNWKRASGIAESVVASLGAVVDARDIYVLNLPDNIGGAYVFRNGLNEAAALLGYAERFRRARPVFWQEMQHRSDTVGVVEDGGRYLVEVSSPRSRLRNKSVSAEGKLSSETFDIMDAGPHSYRVVFKDLADADRISVCRDAQLVFTGRAGDF